MSLERVWNFSTKFMNIFGNLVLLQIFNIALMLTGMFEVVVPIIIMINTIVISEYIYNQENFNFKDLCRQLKKNILSIVTYIIVAYVLIIAFGMNQSMQTTVMSLNVGFWSEIILLVFSVIIGCTLITFLTFFPLVNTTSMQSLSTKLKVTFIVPFFSFKAFSFIVLSTFVNAVFFFSNGLFLIIFGPVLLLAANIIIYNVYIIRQEER